MYTDSDDANALLAKAGMKVQLDAVGKIGVAEWFARYPAHIFCLAAPPGHGLDPVWKKLVPKAAYQQLADDSAAAAMVFGTGRYAPYKAVVGSRRESMLSTNLPKLFHDTNMLPTHIELHAWHRDGGGPLAMIWVDWGQFSEIHQGISVSVVDPQIGAVIETVRFDGGPELELWKRYRVVGSQESGVRSQGSAQ